MAITPRASTSIAYGTRTNTSLNRPTGTTTGDYLVACLDVGGSTAATVTGPTGWTLLGTITYTAPDPWAVVLQIWGIVYDGNASWTWTHASRSSQGYLTAYIGVDNTTPVDVAATSAGKNGFVGGGTVAIAPTHTIATAGARGVIARGSWDGNAITAPAGWSERHDSPVLWVGDRDWASTGATGTVSVPDGNAGANSPWGIVMAALRPAGAGGTDQPLSGTIATTSGLTGVIAARVGLAGAIAVASTLTGTITTDRSLVGSVAATSAVTGSVTAHHPLTGTTTANSTATGSLAAHHPLAGTLAVTTGLTGAITRGQPLAGTTPATSGGTGSITSARALTGTVAGSTALTGSPTSRQGINGATNAVSGSFGAFDEGGTNHALVGNTVATGATTGAITAHHPLAGSTAATSATTGAVTRTGALSGSTNATVTTVGAVTIRLALAGVIQANSNVTGAPALVLGLSGAVEAISGASGALEAPDPGAADPELNVGRVPPSHTAASVVTHTTGRTTATHTVENANPSHTVRSI